MSESIGSLLSSARAAKGVTLAEAAAQLHCDEALLRALESDRFEELGAPVFVQGHLRRYGDYLGAPTGQLMSAWAELRAEKLAEPDLARIPRAPVPAVDPKVWARRAMVAGTTVIIATAVWVILRWGASSELASTASSPASAAVPAPAATAPAVMPSAVKTEASAEVASLSPPAQPEVEPTAVSAATPIPETPVVAAPVAAAPLAATAGVAVLRLVPRQSSWIEVYDASNRRRYYGNAAAGTPLALRGDAPFSVVLGRADAVAIELDGRPITLPAAFVYNATAFVTIDAAGNVQRAAARNTRSTAP